MAYPEGVWLEAKEYYLKGLSLAQISAELGINKTSISKRSKAEGWDKEKIQHLKSDIVEFEKEKSTLDEKKSTLISKISTLDDFEITVLEDIIENEAGIKSLLFSTTALALVRSNEALSKGTVKIPMKVRTFGDNGKPNGETYELVEVPLGSSELKDHVELADKASLTLGINQRHAKSGDIKVGAIAGDGVASVQIYIPSNGRDDDN